MPFKKEKIEEWRKREVNAVFNSSPLIYLTRIGILDVVLGMYKKVYTPEAVKREIIDKGKELNKSDAFILEDYVKKGKIKVQKIKNLETYAILLKNPLIHRADIEAICLAEELKAILVMDDPKAVEIAKMRGIEIEPTLTVILICYALDHIDFEKAETSFKILLKTKFRVKAQEYERALELLEMIRSEKEG